MQLADLEHRLVSQETFLKFVYDVSRLFPDLCGKKCCAYGKSTLETS